ncbi:MAG: hypothetical protein IJ131_07785 [Eggerthellaceae bacterium]|nr:hypothetical protein [Eggerthellaceae bacterium]
MKKISLLAMTLALAAGVLAGCASGGDTGASASASADTAASASAAASADTAATASADTSASAAASADTAASASAAASADTSASAATSSAAASSAATSSAASSAEATTGEDPTPDNPMVVDKEKGEIRYMGFVDGAYVGESAAETRHAVVFEGGSNGQKTIISGYGDEKEFYQACIDLGWEPGNNLTLENQKGGENAATIEGEKLEVTIRWDGQDEMPIWDCIEAANGDTREADWRFGGNIDRANEKNTGCVLCIDSCAVGIVSNAAWPSGTTDADGVTYFRGVADKLPADGTDVIVTFRKAA